jgi:hypothetical protein
VRFLALILATAAAATAIGCGAYVQHGETLYHEGHYIEAAEVFELTEDRLREASPGERAEYGVYRGLTFLRLDDVDNARRWLGYAYALERRDPGALGSYEQSLLARGWAEVEQRSAAPASPEPERVAETDESQAPRPAPGSPNGHRSISTR